MRKILSLLLALNLCAVPCPARSFDHLAPLDFPDTLGSEAAFEAAGIGIDIYRHRNLDPEKLSKRVDAKFGRYYANRPRVIRFHFDQMVLVSKDEIIIPFECRGQKYVIGITTKKQASPGFKTIKNHALAIYPLGSTRYPPRWATAMAKIRGAATEVVLRQRVAVALKNTQLQTRRQWGMLRGFMHYLVVGIIVSGIFATAPTPLRAEHQPTVGTYLTDEGNWTYIRYKKDDYIPDIYESDIRPYVEEEGSAVKEFLNQVKNRLIKALGKKGAAKKNPFVTSTPGLKISMLGYVANDEIKLAVFRSREADDARKLAAYQSRLAAFVKQFPDVAAETKLDELLTKQITAPSIPATSARSTPARSARLSALLAKMQPPSMTSKGISGETKTKPPAPKAPAKTQEETPEITAPEEVKAPPSIAPAPAKPILLAKTSKKEKAAETTDAGPTDEDLKGLEPEANENKEPSTTDTNDNAEADSAKDLPALEEEAASSAEPQEEPSSETATKSVATKKPAEPKKGSTEKKAAPAKPAEPKEEPGEISLPEPFPEDLLVPKEKAAPASSLHSSLHLEPRAKSAIDSAMLAPSSKTGEVKEALIRASYFGIRYHGDRALIPEPVPVASFRIENGSPTSGSLDIPDDKKNAIAEILGIPVEDLPTWWQESLNALAGQMGSLGNEYGWLNLFKGVQKVNVVYGKTDKWAHRDQDGVIWLTLDHFMQKPPATLHGKLKDAYPLAQRALGRVTLIHEGMHESELFEQLVRDALPGQPDAIVHAMIEIFASYMEWESLARLIGSDPRVFEVYQQDLHPLDKAPLKDLMQMQSPAQQLKKIREDITITSERLPLASAAGLKALKTMPDADQLIATAWEKLSQELQIRTFEFAMRDGFSISRGETSHFLNNGVAGPMGFSEIMLKERSSKHLSKVIKSARQLTERYTKLRNLKNPYVLHGAVSLSDLDKPSDAILFKDPGETALRLNLLRGLLDPCRPVIAQILVLLQEAQQWESLSPDEEAIAQNEIIEWAKRMFEQCDALRKVIAEANDISMIMNLGTRVDWVDAGDGKIKLVLISTGSRMEPVVGEDGKTKMVLKSLDGVVQIESPPLEGLGHILTIAAQPLPAVVAPQVDAAA